MRAKRRIGLGHDRANALDVGGDGEADDEFWCCFRFLLHVFRYGCVPSAIATLKQCTAINKQTARRLKIPAQVLRRDSRLALFAR